MPVVARFYGILVKMYFSQSEHGIPHLHAMYGEYNRIFNRNFRYDGWRFAKATTTLDKRMGFAIQK